MVSKISGPGYQTYNYETERWEGVWGIKEVYVDGEWGSRYFQLPSNSWEGERGYVYYKTRNFNLDLSGFRMKVGIFYWF